MAVGGDGNDQLLIIDDPDAVNHGGRLQGGNGDDFLFGGFYDTGTRFDGDAGNDTIIAGPGRDYLYAGDGDDVLYGDGDASLPEYLLTGGPDVLQGGAGDDQLTGGKDKDTLTGGTGADRFIFHIQDSLPGSAGRDVITDFSQAEGDKIDLSDSWYRTSPGHWVATEFTFIGMGAFTGTEPSPGHYNGQVNYRYQGDSIVVSGDANGDKVADFEIVVFGHLTLTADDFLL
ncbi:hypothetical protein P409_23210 [Inquilinus limosus MP06]|uniref:Peptidase M10 serralysin C-terminal domain-containing protein n=1 Tax=Inquilinus limosus MP06 TaxID=1398085 RepID=A0A0A0D293_9PROT|nr:hypothetical protein P409_23210 [Inquilinus limosus MP06]